MNYCKVYECYNAIENHDTGLCATHSKELRKKSKVKTKPYKIPSVSRLGMIKKSNLQKTYHVFDKITPKHCSNCGRPDQLTHSHILPQSQYKTFAADIRNLVFDCVECHTRYEHGDLSECEQLTNWAHRLAVIKALSEIYFFRRFKVLLSDYLAKNPEIARKTKEIKL